MNNRHNLSGPTALKQMKKWGHNYNSRKKFIQYTCELCNNYKSHDKGYFISHLKNKHTLLDEELVNIMSKWGYKYKPITSK